MIRIAIGFVLSFVIGAGCRYFDIPAASPPVIPGALIVLAMTLGYSSMDRTSVGRSDGSTRLDDEGHRGLLTLDGRGDRVVT
jgi:XapX domain-containing protein